MPGILRDGLTMLGTYFLPTALFFIAVAGCGLFVVRRIVGENASIEERFLTGVSLGPGVLALLAFLVVVMGHYWPALLWPGSVLIFALAAANLFVELWPLRVSAVRNGYVVTTGTLALAILLILRLAFLKDLILPPYSDSPVHYQIVLGFLHPGSGNSGGLSIDTLFRDYYHFGFHSLAAWLASLSGLPPEKAISLLGQLLLVICPISVYALTFVVTRSRAGAAFSAALAALAWYMPAYAVNWGKFPALGSMAVLPAIVAAMILGVRVGAPWQRLLLWGTVLVLSAALLHTRSLFFLAFVAIAFFIARKIDLQPGMPLPRAIFLAALYVVSLIPVYSVLHGYYRGFPVLLVVLILLPFAFQRYPLLSAAVFFFTLFLWSATIVLFPGQVGQTLLDRPYLEMSLYIPLSVISGAGFAGLLERLPVVGWPRPVVATLFVGAVLLNFSPYSLRPDACCNYFSQDDQKAFQWIRENTSSRAIFLTAAYVAPENTTVGTDAGVWITPLTGRATDLMLFNTDWTSSVVLDQACDLTAQPIYLYAGGKEFSFATDQHGNSDRLQPFFESGGTVIYRLLNCPK